MLRFNRRWLQTGLALIIGAFSVLPSSVHASQGPVDASTLGFREPNAQEIQAELNLVHSEGVSITVVGHFIRPAMTVMTAQGQSVVATNVPVVEFAIGFIPAGPVPTLQPEAGTVRPHAMQETRSGVHPLDSVYTWQWQDYANGAAGGSPTFYYAAHYNVTCNPNCINYMTNINHKGNMSNSGYTFGGNYWAFNCSSSFPNGWIGSGTSWGVEYSDSWTQSCPNQSTYMWAEGFWYKGSTTYDSYFTDNQQGTTNSPGDYLRF